LSTACKLSHLALSSHQVIEWPSGRRKKREGRFQPSLPGETNLTAGGFKNTDALPEQRQINNRA
jgi:hypothetical protein